MNYKRLCGFILIFVGVITTLYAMHLKGRISAVKETISKDKSIAPSLPGDQMVTQAIESKVSQYDRPVMLLQAGGVVFIILGIGLVFMSRKRK